MSCLVFRFPVVYQCAPESPDVTRLCSVRNSCGTASVQHGKRGKDRLNCAKLHHGSKTTKCMVQHRFINFILE